ncbi:unnamed protein product [Laminaria digitata]
MVGPCGGAGKASLLVGPGALLCYATLCYAMLFDAVTAVFAAAVGHKTTVVPDTCFTVLCSFLTRGFDPRDGRQGVVLLLLLLPFVGETGLRHLARSLSVDRSLHRLIATSRLLAGLGGGG